MAPMTPEWPALVQQARAALRYWDAWCPDDGRPLAALDVAEAYWYGRADRAELGRAYYQVQDALHRTAESARLDVAQARAAWDWLWAVLWLLTDLKPGLFMGSRDLAFQQVQDLPPP